MSATTRLLILWLLFGGTHMTLSSLTLRRPLIGRLGLRGFKSVYTVVALATFIPLMVFYFRNKHAGDVLFAPVPGLRTVTEILMLFAVVIMAQGLATPAPIGTQADLRPAPYHGPRGVQRITRHPLNLGFGTFGVAHCLANPTLGDWIFFGGFTVFALVSAWHQDARLRAEGRAETGRYLQETSYWPFAAVLRGRQRLAFGEFRPVALILGVVVFVALRFLHPRVFGGDWG